MKNILIFSGFMLGSFFLFSSFLNDAKALPKDTPLPEFTSTLQNEWINSAPLSVNDLKGKVVLIDIWTFACWNCYRSFPWLNELEAKYENKGLQVIGIHTPEFEYEKNYDAVAAKTKAFKLKHPVMMDNEFKYWKSLNNRYWPTFYLIDKKGNIRYQFIGETHSGTNKAEKVERAVMTLLAE